MVTNESQVIDIEALAELLTAKGVKLLSAPRVTACAGQECTIAVQSELDYFERNDDGSFVLKKLPAEELPGIRLVATTTQTDKGDVGLDIDFRLNTLR